MSVFAVDNTLAAENIANMRASSFCVVLIYTGCVQAIIGSFFTLEARILLPLIRSLVQSPLPWEILRHGIY
jgi:hypothetical protein